ncbi:hypothetical protein BLNAU_12307 [Blattamonas nauphoetae]|uniref:Uncharacterized protein n=1 Tax=Blattamonas nauphoetae TaxID=2049346 RepID=A0ABQ9XJP2_9EUKA|nr:hypothetical protein BLNAU_12307 [Blattamonas nauphoetae]
MILSPNRNCHFIASKIRSHDVTVGTSPIFDDFACTVEIAGSDFSNINRVTCAADNAAMNTICPDFTSAATYSTNVATSRMWNVTDDLYGSITKCPISGRPFRLRSLWIEHQTIPAKHPLQNTEYSQTIICELSETARISECVFTNIDSGQNDAGLMISCPTSLSLRIESCIFSHLIGDMLAGLSVEISATEGDDERTGDELSIIKTTFTNCTAWITTSLRLRTTSVTISQCVWSECSPGGESLCIEGQSYDPLAEKGLVIERCQFVSIPPTWTADIPMWGPLNIGYEGRVTIRRQTVFKECKTSDQGSYINAVRIDLSQTRFVNCETAGTWTACQLKAHYVSMDSVLVEECRAAVAPNAILVVLFPQIEPDLPTQSFPWPGYAMKDCFIQHDTSGENNVDIIFTVPESQLNDGALVSARFSKVRTTAGSQVIGLSTVNTADFSDSTLYSDVTALTTSQGSDPRTDKDVPDGGEDDPIEEPEDPVIDPEDPVTEPEGPGTGKPSTDDPGTDPETPSPPGKDKLASLPTWSIAVIVVVAVVVVAGVVGVVAIVLVRMKKKKAVNVNETPSSNEVELTATESSTDQQMDGQD